MAVASRAVQGGINVEREEIPSAIKWLQEKADLDTEEREAEYKGLISALEELRAYCEE